MKRERQATTLTYPDAKTTATDALLFYLITSKQKTQAYLTKG